MLKLRIAVLFLVVRFFETAFAQSFSILQSDNGSSPAQGVSQLRIGAGGQITSIDIQCDQGVGICNNSGTTTKVIRTDTGGGYIYNPSAANPGNAGGTGVWQQLATTTALPYNVYGLAGAENVNNLGVYEIRIAPSNTNVIYMSYNGYVLVSTNKGKTFCDTGLTKQTLSPNDNTKFMSPLMAIDPANPDVVMFGTLSNGIYSTRAGRTCGGASWSRISTSSIPAASKGNGYVIAFDPSSTVADGETQSVYVSSYGNGVYHTTTGISGAWSHMSGSPSTQLHIVCASDGVVWFIDNANGNFNGKLWTLTAGTWTQNSEASTQGFRGVAIDPNNPARAVVIDSGGGIDLTINHGASWTGNFLLQNTHGGTGGIVTGSVTIGIGSQSISTTKSLGLTSTTPGIVFSRSNPNNFVRGTVTSGRGATLVINATATSGSGSFSDGLVNWGNPYRVATDIPWLAGTNENYMTAGDIIFDSAQSNTIFFAEGIGVWTFRPPSSIGTFAYTSLNSGIEQLVGMAIVSPWTNGSTPVTASWDRPVFKATSNNSYPLAHGFDYNQAIKLAMGVDWVAGTPTTLVGQTASVSSGITTDGGATWTRFGALPASIETNGQASGSMAASSTTNFIWEQSFNGDPYYTTDGGETWTKICVSDIPCGTTSTSNKIITGSGNVTFTTAGSSDCTYLNFVGTHVVVYENVGNSAGMSGTISSCTSGNQLVISVTSSFGSGSFASWKIRPDTGWGSTPGSNFQTFAADRVDATTYYAYNLRTNSIYRSTASTPSFTQAAATPFTAAVSGVIPRMKAVPGYAGNVFWTPGIVIGNPYPNYGIGLYRTIDHGATWTDAGNASYRIQEVWDFGFGNSCGGPYPTIFLYGWIGVHATFTSGSASISATNNFAPGQPVTFLAPTAAFGATRSSRTTSTRGPNFPTARGKARPADLQSSPGSLPTNFATRTTYFVTTTGLSSSAFQVALTIGGTPIVAANAGSGTQTVLSGGIWRSKDNATTWQQLTGLFPDTIIDQISSVEGDANTCGKFYFSKLGTGWSYGQFNFLLKRDLDPTTNDNEPMWLPTSA